MYRSCAFTLAHRHENRVGKEDQGEGTEKDQTSISATCLCLGIQCNATELSFLIKKKKKRFDSQRY